MRSIMAMLRHKGADAGALYDAVVSEARRPAWYREGAVADSMGGATDASSPDDDGLRRNRHSVVVPYFSFAPRG